MLDFSSQMIDVSPLAFATIFCLTDESTLRWRNLNRALPRLLLRQLVVGNARYFPAFYLKTSFKIQSTN